MHPPLNMCTALGWERVVQGQNDSRVLTHAGGLLLDNLWFLTLYYLLPLSGLLARERQGGTCTVRGFGIPG